MTRHLEKLNQYLNRSKRSRLLTRDSSMNIWPNNNILNSITYNYHIIFKVLQKK